MSSLPLPLLLRSLAVRAPGAIVSAVFVCLAARRQSRSVGADENHGKPFFNAEEVGAIDLNRPRTVR